MMIHIALPMLITSATVAQHIDLSDPSKLALDMNVEIVTLLEIEHYASPPADAPIKEWQHDLDEARKAVESNPENATNQLAYGRALERLWLYHDAVQAYTNAIKLALREPEGYVERGEAFVVLRWFEHAQTDLEKANELGANNFSAWYGLGLTHYFQQNFDDAVAALREARRVATSTDDQLSAAFWTYLTLRRLDQTEEADAVLTQARDSAGVASAKPYLEALKFFKGDLTREDLEGRMKAGGRAASIFGYALGAAALLEGNQARALDYWREVVAQNTYWPAHGHIAAEAEIVAIEGVQKSLPQE